MVNNIYTSCWPRPYSHLRCFKLETLLLLWRQESSAVWSCSIAEHRHGEVRVQWRQQFYPAVTWGTGLISIGVPSYSRIKLLPPHQSNILFVTAALQSFLVRPNTLHRRQQYSPPYTQSYCGPFGFHKKKTFFSVKNGYQIFLHDLWQNYAKERKREGKNFYGFFWTRTLHYEVWQE